MAERPDERRQHPRAEFVSYVEIRPVLTPHVVVQAVCMDVSETGLRIKVGTRFTMGDLVGLQALDSEGKPVFKGDARVMWTSFNGPPYESGLMFENLSEATLAVLKAITGKPAPVAQPEPLPEEPATPTTSREPAPDLPTMEDTLGKADAPAALAKPEEMSQLFREMEMQAHELAAVRDKNPSDSGLRRLSPEEIAALEAAEKGDDSDDSE